MSNVAYKLMTFCNNPAQIPLLDTTFKSNSRTRVLKQYFLFLTKVGKELEFKKRMQT